MMLEQNLLSRFVIGASFAPLYYPKYKKSEILSPKIKIFSKKFSKKFGAAPIWDGSMRQSVEMSRNVQSGNTQNLKSSAAPVRLPAAPAPTPGTSRVAVPAGCVYRP